MKRAQAIVELYLALSLVMVLMLFLVTVEGESVQTSIELIREAEGRVAVQEIADAANAVFIEGGGAYRVIYVNIPPNFNPEESFIGAKNGSGNIVNIRLDYPNGPIDVQARTNAFLEGSLSNRSGMNVIQVTMDEYYPIVHVSRPVAVADPSSVQIVLEPGENLTASTFITYYREGDDPIAVRVEPKGEAGSWILSEGLAVASFHKNEVKFTTFVPELALPGTYEATLYLKNRYPEDPVIELSIPVNIVVIRGYEWMRLEPIYREVSFVNSSDYAENYTTNFILCNDHTDKKTMTVEGGPGGLTFNVNGSPVDFSDYTWGGDPIFNESGYWFNKTTFFETASVPFGSLTTKEFTQTEEVDGGLCTSFLFIIRVDGGTIDHLFEHIWEVTNNSSIKVLNMPYAVKATSGGMSNIAEFNVTIDSTG